MISLEEWLEVREEEYLAAVIPRVDGAEAVVNIAAHWREHGAGSSGTGFIYRVDEGQAYVLTAFHVVLPDADRGPADQYAVFQEAGDEFVTAELVHPHDLSRQRDVDLAVLRFPCEDCRAVHLSDVDLLTEPRNWGLCMQIELDVVTVAFPDSSEPRRIEAGTLSTVSLPCDRTQLRHTGYVARGYSGSPVFHEGKVVGINVGAFDDGQASFIPLTSGTPHTSYRNILRRGWDQ